MIKISSILCIIIPFVILFVLNWCFYRFILHPDYRWHQRGNICYDYAIEYSIIASLIMYILGLLIYFNKIIW